LNIKTPYREALLELFFAISGFLRVADQYDDSYTTCYEKIDKDLKIKLFCIDPSGHLNHALKRCHAAIFFSATMTPISYFKTIFGCEDHADRLILPSPFPINPAVTLSQGELWCFCQPQGVHVVSTTP
jgi:DNA excision repair protein ERCC-2